MDGVSFGPEATFDVLTDAALVKPRTKGYLIARNVLGTVCPTLGEHLVAEGWLIALANGEVRIMKPTGLLFFVR